VNWETPGGRWEDLARNLGKGKWACKQVNHKDVTQEDQGEHWEALGVNWETPGGHWEALGVNWETPGGHWEALGGPGTQPGQGEVGVQAGQPQGCHPGGPRWALGHTRKALGGTGKVLGHTGEALGRYWEALGDTGRTWRATWARGSGCASRSATTTPPRRTKVSTGRHWE